MLTDMGSCRCHVMEKDSSLPQPFRRTMSARDEENIIQSSWLRSLWPEGKGLGVYAP